MPEQSLDYRRQVKLVIFSTIVQGIFYLRGILLLPILTHNLGPEAYGVWSKMFAAINLAFAFADLQIRAGESRFLPAADQGQRGVIVGGSLAVNAAGGLLTIFGFFLAFPWLSELFTGNTGIAFTPAMCLALALAVPAGTLLQFCKCYYNNTDKPLKYGLIVGLEVGSMFLGVLLGWLTKGASLWMPLAAFALGPICVAIYGVAIICKEARPAFKHATWRNMLVFSAPSVPAMLFYWSTQYADRYFMTFMLPGNQEKTIGIYSANYSLAGLIPMAFSPFIIFFTPSALRLWEKHKRAEAFHLCAKTVKFSLLCAIPFIFAAPLLADEGMRVIAGKAFCAEPSLIFVIMLGYTFFMLGELIALPVIGEYKTGWRMGFFGAAAAVNWALNYYLIPQIDKPWGGINGAAIAMAAGYIVFFFLTLLAGRRLANAPFPWLDTAKLALSAALCATLLWLWHPEGKAGVFLSVLASLCLYALLLWAMRIVTKAETLVIRDALQSLHQKFRATFAKR